MLSIGEKIDICARLQTQKQQAKIERSETRQKNNYLLFPEENKSSQSEKTNHLPMTSDLRKERILDQSTLME